MTNNTIYNNGSITPVTEIAVRSASLIFIALLSIFGNSLVCITLYRRPYLLTPSNKLVFSLTTANFVFSILVLPFVISGSITEQWFFGKVWCAITGFLTLLVMGASMLILAAIACDRYYAIVHPMLYPSIITGFRSTVIIIVCWVFAAICATPPLFGAWSRYQFQPKRCGCLPVWQEELGFAIFWFALCFFAPYLLMICCYGFIFKIARTKTRQVHSRVDSPSRFAGPNDDTSSNSSSDSGSYTEFSDSFPTTRVIGANSSSTTQQAPNGKIHTKSDLNDNAATTLDEDSGINVSETVTPPSTLNNGHHHHIHHGRENGRKSYLENGRTYLPNQVEGRDSPKFMSRRSSNVGMDADVSQTEAELQLRNSRKSSNASIVSSTSQVFRRTSLAFSAVKYYSNQMKAVFTIAFILGILLVTMGPFVVTALVEASHGVDTETYTNTDIPPPSPVPKITLSIATCFMYLTCVYYPLIYGLWNRTVRKEMKYLLCGYQHPDHRQMNRTRILSLTTHIQDLGMSPGLTAAIIGESDPTTFNTNFMRDRNFRASTRHIRSDKEEVIAAANKRRHTLHSLSGSLLPQVAPGTTSPAVHGRSRHHGFLSRMRKENFHDRLGTDIGVIAEESDQEESGGSLSRSSNQNNFSNNSSMRRWRHGYTVKTVSDTINETGEGCSTYNAPVTSGYKMRLQTKDDVQVPISYEHKKNQSGKTQSRAREKPAISGLLELSSAEVLSSTALSSALLFAGYDFNNRRGNNPVSVTRRTLSDPGEHETASNNDIVISADSAESNKESESSTTNTELALALGNIPSSKPKPIMQPAVMYQKSDSENDKISVITQGRLHGSNLIHLEAGEPTTVRKWSESQFVDFFASSIAYGVVEAGKVKAKEEERCPSRN
nr:probable G-protein coupled receptor 101 isoform X2 [Styela clava]